MEGEKYPPLQCVGWELVFLDDEGVIYDSFFRVHICRAGVFRTYVMRSISLVVKMLKRYSNLRQIPGVGFFNDDAPME